MPVKPRRVGHLLNEDQLQDVADLFAVLSEPTRLRILQMLQSRPANVSQIVSALGLKQANVSKQLAILHQAGVLKRTKTGNVVEYAIGMALVFDLCALVCDGLREGARQKLRRLT
jgi:DNA-binding transcriptional ArsR family regulator